MAKTRYAIWWALMALGVSAGVAVADYTVKDSTAATLTFDSTTNGSVHTSHHVVTNGAGVQQGTSGAPFRVDPTGSTTQPVSAASWPLPTGAATAAGVSAVLDGLGDLITTGSDANANTLDQMVASAWLHGFNGTTWDRLRSDTTYGLDVDVRRSASSTGYSDTLSVGTSEARFSASSIPLTNGLTVYSFPSNTAACVVYFVASGGADGIWLNPGDSHTFPIDDVNKVYLLCTAASQLLGASTASATSYRVVHAEPLVESVAVSTSANSNADHDSAAVTVTRHRQVCLEFSMLATGDPIGELYVAHRVGASGSYARLPLDKISIGEGVTGVTHSAGDTAIIINDPPATAFLIACVTDPANQVRMEWVNSSGGTTSAITIEASLRSL